MPIPKGRGKVVKVRNKKIKGHKNEYLQCDIMEESGKRGGKTVCHVKKKKKKKGK